jgi:membrane associated rhomboid family serine protease
MTNYLESSGYADYEKEPGWLKVGAIAAASALAGGLLAAWWYRATLNKLRQAEQEGENPQIGIPEDDEAEG